MKHCIFKTDNYILQKYFFDNFQNFTSVENIDVNKTLKELQEKNLKLKEVKFNENKDRLFFDADDYVILKMEDIISTINVYKKSLELIEKYHLPEMTDTFIGKRINRIIEYDNCHEDNTVIIVFEDNTFYFVSQVCAVDNYVDHEPCLRLGYFSYNYHFFKEIGNIEIAREFEDYRQIIKYKNR